MDNGGNKASKPNLVLAGGWRGVQRYLTEIVRRESSGSPLAARELLILVPTTAAGHLLQTTLEQALLQDRAAVCLPTISTTNHFLQSLADRSLGAVRVADPILREALLEEALEEASQSGCAPPFSLRSSLMPRVLALYDHLYRTGHGVEEFAARALEEFDDPSDRGAERMAAQTRYLTDGLRRYTEKLRGLEWEDEVSLRQALLERGPRAPYPKVLAVGPTTLWPVDVSFLLSLPGLKSLELILPEGLEQSWRVRQLFPEASKDGWQSRRYAPSQSPPSLWCPQDAATWIARDREDVLAEVARLLKSKSSMGGLPPLERIAVVVPSPLPHLYLAKKTLARAGIPYQLQDDFPLATEPYIAAMDVLLDFVTQEGRQAAALELLRNPFFRFPEIGPTTLNAFHREIIKRRELGGLKRWRRMIEHKRRQPTQRALPGMEDREERHSALPALEILVRCGKRLAPLASEDTSISEKIDALRKFVDRFGRPLAGMEDHPRHERARGAFLSILESLADATRAVADPPLPFSRFREKLRRAIEGRTFSIRAGTGGVQIVDRRSVGFGAFDLLVAVGLNESEWPTRSDRNIFYPQWLLKRFGWPTDGDILALERIRFREILRFPARHVAAFRHLLEEDIPTVPSPFIEELETMMRGKEEPVSGTELNDRLVSRAEALRAGVLPAGDRIRAHKAGILQNYRFDPEPVSATAFELYLRCPFKHYSRYVLGVEEEEDMDESFSPMERGRILHTLLQVGFERWDAHHVGPRPVTTENYEDALALFKKVAIEKLPSRRRAIEMERLFGGPGEAGAIEWLLRRELGRGRLRRRFLEFGFQDEFRFDEGPNGEKPWRVRVKGRADRVDVDLQGRLRLFDYKSGRAPETKLTVQIPLYAFCLSQLFSAPAVEAAYLSLRDKRAVPRQDWGRAVAHLSESYKSMTEGLFPPHPYQDHLCNRCGYAGLCRKEIEEQPSVVHGETA